MSFYITILGGRRFSEGTSADREIQRTLMEVIFGKGGLLKNQCLLNEEVNVRYLKVKICAIILSEEYAYV